MKDDMCIIMRGNCLKEQKEEVERKEKSLSGSSSSVRKGTPESEAKGRIVMQKRMQTKPTRNIKVHAYLNIVPSAETTTRLCMVT